MSVSESELWVSWTQVPDNCSKELHATCSARASISKFHSSKVHKTGAKLKHKKDDSAGTSVTCSRVCASLPRRAHKTLLLSSADTHIGRAAATGALEGKAQDRRHGLCRSHATFAETSSSLARNYRRFTQLDSLDHHHESTSLSTSERPI